VRQYAVSCLEPLGEDEFMDYLLQLVQVLKYEPYHNSGRPLPSMCTQSMLTFDFQPWRGSFWHVR